MRMRPLLQWTLTFGLCLGVWGAHAEVQTYPVSVTRLVVYPDYGGGDVVFKVGTAVAGCDDGFWLSPTDPGFKQLYAALLLGKATRTTLSLVADERDLWPGSGGKVCHVVSVALE